MLNSLKRRVSKVIKKIDNSQNSFPIRQHNGSHCESCGTKNIIGDLFCCTICADYNLCSECFCSKLTSKNHELNHPCLIVTHPSRPPQSTRLDVLKETFKNKDFNISCDISYESKIRIFF
ncbi:unnamed protein product [Brachionus calyciflorus]|uniref:ZZ-type domain-containing protein n=1 Tax=Brachionus calyciflorus TaxID=104777 RepID=A0A814NRQ4_9BILA|nr:unnamed protein product [Brachionus calyciflorus]